MRRIEKFRYFVLGIVATLILSTSIVPALAATISKQVTAYYNNIKIYVDGAEVVPKDGNGNVVEPFTIDGTTYLPVRAIANAIGKDVIWDGATQSVYLGKKDQNQPDNYLDKIQYNYFGVGYDRNKFYKINGTVTDFLGNTRTNGIILNAEGARPIENDKDNAVVLIDYPLNSVYQTLNGKISLPKNIDIAGLQKNIENKAAIDVLFYGDDKLIYNAKSITNTMPFDISIDVRGVNKLTIKIAVPEYQGGFSMSNNIAVNSYVALTDLALYK